MDTSCIDRLTEAECKKLLDYQARKAFGKSAYVKFLEHGTVVVNIKNIQFFLIAFQANRQTGTLHRIPEKSFKNALKDMLSCLKHSTDYISYLVNRSHFLDGSMSLEQIMIEMELAQL